MRAQGGGRIINIASIAGLVPLRLQCAFVAAKAGVVNLTQAMALELGPARHPGQRHRARLDPDRGDAASCSTARTASSATHVQRMLDHVPLGRPGDLDEIAVAALFLADPENSYMNGHILTVDGGWTAGYTRDF